MFFLLLQRHIVTAWYSAVWILRTRNFSLRQLGKFPDLVVQLSLVDHCIPLALTVWFSDRCQSTVSFLIVTSSWKQCPEPIPTMESPPLFAPLKESGENWVQ